MTISKRLDYGKVLPCTMKFLVTLLQVRKETVVSVVQYRYGIGIVY